MVIKIEDIREKVMGCTNPKFRTIPRRTRKDISFIVIHSTICDGYPAKMILDEMIPYCTSNKNHFSQNGAPCFSYHMVVEDKRGESLAYRCLDYDVRAWHVGSWNRWSVGIAAIGIETDPKRKDVLAFLASVACLELSLSPKEAVMFHKDAPACYKVVKGEKKYFNTCPGFDEKPFMEMVLGIHGELDAALKEVVGVTKDMGVRKTKQAIEAFEKEEGLPVTGVFNYDIIKLCYGL